MINIVDKIKNKATLKFICTLRSFLEKKFYEQESDIFNYFDAVNDNIDFRHHF